MTFQFVAISLVLLIAGSGSAQLSTLPFAYPARVINATGEALVCPSAGVRQTVRSEVEQDIQTVLDYIVPGSCRPFQTENSPATSCSGIPTSCSSGYYWIRSSNGTAVQVYCDMNRVCGCNSTGGWTRVANLNMSDPSQQCPGEWILNTYSSEPRRLCGRAGSSCYSATYSTYGISYSHVCGRVIGYQYYSTDAFVGTSIDSSYVDGVSLTHGPPGARQHIWTFACGLTERVHPSYPSNSCPCVSGTVAPSFVGSDYFCESGNPGSSFSNIVYASDPLWDGQGCGSPPCCELSSPSGVTAPWFCKQLPQATTDDIEARICSNQSPSNEDTPVELIELFIY